MVSENIPLINPLGFSCKELYKYCTFSIQQTNEISQGDPLLSEDCFNNRWL